MTKDGKPVDVDLHQLLATKLNSAGIDAHSALRQNSLPKKLAATLLRDGLMALKAAGYEGPLFDVLNGAMTIDSKFDNVVVYQRAYDDEGVRRNDERPSQPDHQPRCEGPEEPAGCQGAGSRRGTA
jgi:hypothetical protein